MSENDQVNNWGWLRKRDRILNAVLFGASCCTEWFCSVMIFCTEKVAVVNNSPDSSIKANRMHWRADKITRAKTPWMNPRRNDPERPTDPQRMNTCRRVTRSTFMPIITGFHPLPKAQQSMYGWFLSALVLISKEMIYIHARDDVRGGRIFAKGADPKTRKFEAGCFSRTPRVLTTVEFLRALGSQSGVSIWQHTLVG